MEVQVIVPVGPGHGEIALEAIYSAKLLGYDVIPIDDMEGKLGRSHARNIAVKKATAEWVFFLDADDVMHPDAKKAEKYTEYDAIWGLINDGRVRIPQVRNVDYGTLCRHDPTRTLQMGHFVKREIALKYPFDEDLDCGEDFDYYLRVWKDEKCIKIPHTLFINRRGNHSTGPRSADGRMWRENVQIIQACHLAGGIRKVGDMYLPAGDRMFVRSFQNGQIFDQQSFYTAMKYCKKRDMAVDGGAHVGSWTKALENKFKNVIAFEPSKDNFKCLKRNVNANIHRKALGEKAKRISIEKTDPRNTGQDHVTEGDEVEMIALDSLNLDELDFLKLDVEGYEYFALEGAKKTLERCKPVVLIEANGLSSRYGIDDTYADRFLKDLGYREIDQCNKDHIYQYGPT